MKDRFIEVLAYIVAIVSATTLLFIVSIVPALYMTEETEGAFIVVGVFALITSGIIGILWVGNYIIRGQKLRLISILTMVFGVLPQYFWFVCFILYMGGISKAIYGGASDEVVWWNDFASGTGAAVAVLSFGSVGRLYRRNKFFGHVVGTVVVGIFTLVILVVQARVPTNVG